MQRRVRYHRAYALPALIMLILTAVIAFATQVFILRGRVSMGRMRQHLNKTSPSCVFILSGRPKGRDGRANTAGNPQAEAKSSEKMVENISKYSVTLAKGDNEFLIMNGSRTPQAFPCFRGL